MKLTNIGLFAIGLLLLVQTSEAAPIAYEGFDYPIGSTLSNLNGGIGWSNAWTGANFGAGPNSSQSEFVVTNGLNWSNTTGGYILGTGGAIFDHDAAAHGSYRQWFDPNANITDTWGTNIWFSFIATYDTASGSGGTVNLFEAANDATTGFGIACVGPGGGGDFIVQLRVGQLGQAPGNNFAGFGLFGGTVNNLRACQPGVTTGKNLVVCRFQLSTNVGPFGALSPYTGGDRMDVWLNPTTEPVGDSELFFTGFYANRNSGYSTGQLGIRTGGACQMTIDEIRIGTTFADVVNTNTASSPTVLPTPPMLAMESAGPVGLQFNLAEASPTNSNEIATSATTNSTTGAPVPIDCSWVTKTPASYSFTIAKGPALDPAKTNFMAYLWLIPSPNGHIQALDNINAVQLALISDGQGNAKAVLGYYVNSSGSVQDNLQTLLTSPSAAGVGGVICSIPSAPFAGTWTVSLTSDTGFTLTAPNGLQASGSMQSGDESNFGSGVTGYLGVSPNGGPNVGNPSLGLYMTVSSVLFTNSTPGPNVNTNWGPGAMVQSDFSTGAPLTALSPPNWLVNANLPSCIYEMPAGSVYRATWGNACGTRSGANTLTTTTNLPTASPWPTVVPTTAILGDGTDVSFVTTKYITNNAGYYRVSAPYTP